MELTRLILVDTKPELCEKLSEAFSKHNNVEVICGTFQDVKEWDYVVSPANSYGMMDGGFDYHLAEFFGKGIQDAVQNRIIYEYAGLQPVGTSVIVETGNKDHPYLVHTPTMRYPMKISRTINVYLAMKAMLLAVKAHTSNTLKRVLCPGLGTGAGGVNFETAAYQMALAYEHVYDPPEKIDWGYVNRIERSFSGGSYER